MRFSGRIRTVRRLHSAVMIVLATVISSLLLASPLVMAQHAAAQLVIVSAETKTRILSTTITDYFRNTNLYFDYVRNGNLYLYSYDSLGGYYVHLDYGSNLVITDNGNVITFKSKVLSSDIAGIAPGNTVSCTIDLNAGSQKCDNLTLGTSISGTLLSDTIFRKDINTGSDTTPPTVSITSPSNGATISGTTVVTASASDNVGVSKVEFYVDNVLKSTDSSSPYSFNWDTTTLSDGTHAIKTVAFDTSGNSANTQHSVDIDNSSPAVTISSPLSGSIIKDIIPFSASASDNSGISKVDFYVDGTFKGTDTTLPYSISLDTTTLSDGSHTFKVIAFDSHTNQGTSQLSVTVDNSPAIVSISSPPNGSTLSGTIPFSASASDPHSGVSMVRFYVDNIIKTTDSSSPYSYSLDTTSLSDGSHVLKVIAYNGAGSEASAQVSITVSNIVPDTTAPVLTIQSNMTVEATSASGAVVTFTATATDNVDGTVPVACTPASGSTFPIGTTTVNCSATDSAGNTATGSFTITVKDTTSPTVSITSPSNGATVSGTTTVIASASDSVGMSKVSFYVDNVLRSTDTSSPYTFNLDTTTLSNAVHTVKAVAFDTSNNQASHQISVTVSNSVPDTTDPVLSLPSNMTVEATSASGAVVTFTATATDNVDGTVPVACTPASGSTFPIGTTTVNCSATDSAGNTANGSFTVTVRDTKVPTVSITSPANGALVKGTIIISVSASDNIAMSKVEAYVDNVLGGADTLSPYSFSLNTGVLSNGSHTIKVVAYDASGNQASAQISIAVDNTAPTVSITSPSNGSTVSGSTTTSAAASDNIGIAKVAFYVDNVLTRTEFELPYSFSLDTTTLSDGSHTIKAIAYDTVNNQASAQISVTVSNPVPDTTAPSVSITSPTNESTVSGSITVSASASDNVGVSKVEFYVDTALESTDTTNDYSFSLDTTTLPNGTYAIKAVAHDTSGNQSFHQISVNVSNSAADTTSPTVLITSPADGATISGTVTVTASASDESGIYRVYFYVDGAYKAYHAIVPYTYTLETAEYADGTHKIRALAYDNAFNSASHEITVEINNTVVVQDTTAPTLTLPSNMTVEATSASGATVAYAASATDDIDGTVPVSCTPASGATFPIGTTTVNCSATDSAGNTANGSFAVTVVEQPASKTNSPPSVRIVEPSKNSPASGTLIVEISASDQDGSIDRVEVYIDGTLKATLAGKAGSTYAYSWDTTSETNGTHIIKVVAYDNLGDSAQDSKSVKVSNKETGGGPGGKGGGPKK